MVKSRGQVTLSTDDRGQALTLEAITAAILLLAAVGFALEMTAVTPLSASTSSQHLENQLQSSGQGVLASTEDTGDLKEAVLYWNATDEEFHKSGPREFYRNGAPENEFGDVLERTYGERNIAFNVVIHYHTGTGELKEQVMVNQGEPSDHAVSSSHTVLLTDDDRLVESDGSPGATINGSNFYAPDAAVENGGDRELYNLVRVEVIAWRI
jgi:hypothetical protein